MERINGAELVNRVLNDPFGSVEKLIQLAGNKETEWLELKASLLPEYTVENGKKKYLYDEGKNEVDYAWHVVKAIIAMANTHGGAVILGVDDNCNVVGLEASDKKGVLKKNEDEFARNVLDRALKPTSSKWVCHKEEYELTGTSYYPLIHYQFTDFQGERIVAVIVDPVPADSDLILIEEKRISREVLLVRDRGQIGRIREYFRKNEYNNYLNQRTTAQESYALVYEQYKLSLSPCAIDVSQDALLKSVQQYHSLLRKTCAETEMFFIQLNAEENSNIDNQADLFEPLAEEYLSSDMIWLEKSDNVETESPSCLNLEETDIQEDLAGELKEEKHDISHEIIKIARRGGVFSLLAEEPRSMLLGEPGCGKTTCLKYLALEATKNYVDKGIVALFIPLSRYRGPGDLFPLAIRATRFSKKETGLTMVDIEWLLKSQKLQLLLDALNECPTKYTRYCVEEIKLLLERYPDMPIIITSRTYAYREQIGLPAFSVQPMDVTQQRYFLVNHLRSERHADQIMTQLQRQQGGDVLASNPLLLRLVVETVRGGEPLPLGRATLYRQFLERWYVRETGKARDANCPLQWDKGQTLAAMSQMAFHTRLLGQRSVSRDQAAKILIDVVPNPDDFIDRMAQGLLLTCDFDGMIDFLHETFQEYLAAEFLICNPKAIIQISDTDKDRWGMILAYVIELNPKPNYEMLIEIAKLNPWVAGCAESGINIIKSEILTTLNQPIVKALYELFMTGQGAIDNLSELESESRTESLSSYLPMLIPILGIIPMLLTWWKNSSNANSLLEILSPAIRYLLDLFSDAYSRWDKMTEVLVRSIIIDKNKLHILGELLDKKWPTIKNYKEIIVSSYPVETLPIQYALLFVKAELIEPSDFQKKMEKCVFNLTPIEAVELVKAGWMQAKDFIKPAQAQALAEAGLTIPDKIKKSAKIIAHVRKGLANSKQKNKR